MDIKDSAVNNEIMRYFEYSHLPEYLQKASKPLGDLAAKRTAS